MSNQQHSYNRYPSIAAVICLWFAAGTLVAQEPADPFGAAPGGGDVFSGAPAPQTAPATNAKEILADDPDPVIRMLRSHPPKTPDDFADGLTWTIRLKRWDEVGRLLDRLQALNWSLEQKATIARRMGAAMVLRMRSAEATLTEAQKSIAGELFQAPSQLVRDPAWIDQTIDALASLVPAERRSAQLRLHDGSSIAIARLVNRLLAGDAKVAPLQLASAAVSFGDDGKDALRAACLVPNAAASSRVILALADLPAGEFGTELGAALVSRGLDPAVQQSLSKKLASKFAALPTPQAIETHVAEKFAAALQTYQQQRQIETPLTDHVWRPAADGKSIERSEVSPADRALEIAARYAAYRMQSQVATDEGLAASAAVLLQRAYKMRPQLFAGELASFELAPIAAEVREDHKWWQSVFARCQEWNLHGGALRALQAMADQLVMGKAEASIGFLTNLLKDPTPAIRYTALEVLAKLDPQSSYYGNEWAVETAIEMTRLQSGPHALVIGLQGELRQAAQQQINLQTSSDVTVVNSGVAALKVLNEPYPVELIFIVDRVADQSISQLVQRLRNSKRGRSLPIAILTEQLYSFEKEIIDTTSGVVTSILSRNAEQMQRVMTLMQANLDTAPMTPADRASYAASGTRFLAKIAADREHYAFYPLNAWHSAIVDGGMTSSTESQIILLAGFGTSDSQWRLANMTWQSTLKETERVDAAKAFGRSVRQFGMNLNREHVLQTYDLYNEVGPNDPIAVKATGLILDVIEAQAGKAPWPEGL